MKKLILSLLAAGFAATTFAHGGGGGMEQGNILLYGVGTYSNHHGTNTNKFGTSSTSTSDKPREIMWEVAPGVGFNVMDNLTIGVDGYYTGTKTTYDKKDLSFVYAPTAANPSGLPTDQVKTYDYGVGPFVRYSMPISEHFFAFGQFTAHYLNGRVATRTVTALNGGNSFTKDDNYKGLDASFVPAVGAMLTKTLGLTFAVGGVGYEYKKYDYSTQGLAPGSSMEAKDNQFIVTFGQQFNLGIQKYFGCGMKHHHTGAEPMDETRHMDTTDDSSEDTNMDGGKKKHHKRHRKNDDE